MAAIPESVFRTGPKARLVTQLGEYARWFGLNGAELPVLPTVSGAALLLTARLDEKQSADFPDAFMFPVCWVKDTPENANRPSSVLPEGILAEAERVLLAFGRDAQGWRLAPLTESLARVDLSQMPAGGDSGVASLTAALSVAIRGSRTKPGVFASAGWRDQMLRGVGGIDKKAKLLATVGKQLAARPTLFVHADNEKDARSAAGGDVEIKVFEPLSTKGFHPLPMQIRAMLVDLQQLPRRAAGDSWKTRTEAFNAPGWPTEPDRLKYFVDEVVEELAEVFRASQDDWGRTFVLLYNPSNETMSYLFLKMIRPSKVILVRQTDKKSDRDNAEIDRARSLMKDLNFSPDDFEIRSIDPRLSIDHWKAQLDIILGDCRRFGDCRYVDGQNATSFLRAVSMAVARQLNAIPLGLEQVWDSRTLRCDQGIKLLDFSFVWR